MFRCLLLSVVVLIVVSPAAAEDMPVRGMTLANTHRGDMGYGSDSCREQLDELAELGVNWIAVCAFAWMEGVNDPEVRIRRRGSGDHDGIRRTIADAHERGIQVMLKPHVWSRDFGNGVDWHGTIAMDSEEEWAAFFQNYTAYLVEQAKLAADTGADALCLGVEMMQTSGRSDDWRRLIAAVREHYDGPLTYSAHVDEYRRIEWWDAVDVIGISAYFPLATEGCVTEQAAREAWSGIYRELGAFSAEAGRPVCFTEIGYSASSRAGSHPWEPHEVDPDRDYQAMLWRVAIEEAAGREFLVGLFGWKWFTGDLASARRIDGRRFSASRRARRRGQYCSGPGGRGRTRSDGIEILGGKR